MLYFVGSRELRMILLYTLRYRILTVHNITLACYPFYEIFYGMLAASTSLFGESSAIEAETGGL